MKPSYKREAIVLFILTLTLLAIGLRPANVVKSAGANQSSPAANLKGEAAVNFLRANGMLNVLTASGTFVQQAKVVAGDGAFQDSMGFSVAIDGDTAVVGSPADQVGTFQRQGSAYVYVRNGTTWTQQQKLTAADGVAQDEFGYAVAISGNTIFVGRHFVQSVPAARTRGAVYVFTRSGTTWTQQATPLTPSDAADGDVFGNSLAYDNGTLIVGALQKNNGSTFFQGAAYVFTGSAGSFTQQAKLLSSDGGFADFFGWSAAVSGDTALIGAPGQVGSGAASGRGWAYVFTRSGSTWTQQQKLLASDGVSGDSFGFSLGVSGDSAIIGARLDTVNGVGAQGSAYIFVRSGTTWTEQQHLFGVETTQRNDNFGYAVGIKGDTVAIGSPAHEVISGIANHGAVYVFTRNGTTWSRQQKLIHSDASADALGQAVAFDGPDIIAGAPAKDSARGAAYIFSVDPLAGPKLVANDGLTNDNFGRSVAISGDTAIVGAPFDDRTIPDEGSAYVFVRSGAAWTLQAKITTPNNQPSLGACVAIDGDTAAIGVRNGAASRQGADLALAYVFVRSGSTWTQQAMLVPSDGLTHQADSIAIDGDTVVAGSNGDKQAYVFVRNGTNWTAQQTLTATSSGVSDYGVSISVSGNTMAVGSPSDNLGNADQLVRGAVYIYTRTGTVWTQQQQLVPSDITTGKDFGRGIGLSGDTIVIGAPQDDLGANPSSGANQGSAYVFTRNGTTWTQQQKLSPADAGLNDMFGNSVALTGDTALIGARLDSFGVSPNIRGNQGSAYVYKRSGGSFTENQKLVAFDGAASDQLGWAVGVTSTTAIAGAPFDQVEGVSAQGSAYIFDLTNGSTPTPTPVTVATAAGSNVQAQGNGVSITFANVSAAGATTISPINPASAGTLPSGYLLFGSSTAFEITTTATAQPPINVCFNVPAVTDPTTFSQLRLLHGENGVLIDRTTVNDFATKMVCGIVSSLSPFVLATTPVSQIQFNATSYSVSEGSEAAIIGVSRLGSTATSMTVAYGTADGTATQRTDYTIASGTITFAAGEMNKNVAVLIVDDNYVDGNETLNLNLSDPTGAPLGTPPAAVLTIADNDSLPPTSNPLDNSDARFFVRQHFYDFLSRIPDAGGFDYWASQLTQCGGDANCLRTKRTDVSNAFFYELEFQQTGAYVYRLYRAAYGNNQPFPSPDSSNPVEANKLPSYAVFARDRSRVVGGADLAQGQSGFANAFVLRNEFTTRYPLSMDGPTFVDAVLTTINNDLAVDLSAQRAALINLFNSGGRGAVLYRLADDNQANPINNRGLIDAEYNRAFVATQYFGYLRRDADLGGFLFWLGQVNGSALRDVPKQHAMVCSFITSTEYQQRFSSVATHSNSECGQ